MANIKDTQANAGIFRKVKLLLQLTTFIQPNDEAYSRNKWNLQGNSASLEQLIILNLNFVWFSIRFFFCGLKSEVH